MLCDKMLAVIAEVNEEVAERAELEKNNLPKITFHALRHTNASIMISEDVDVVTVSGRLGHADKNVTLNTYSHIIKSKEKQAANKMSDFYEKYL